MDSLFDALLAGSLAANPDGSSVNYNNISNKPQINGVTLSGDKSSADLSLATSAQGAAADTAIQSFKIDGGSELKSGTSVNVTSMPASILTGAIANGVTATTQSAGDKSNKVATTDYVDTAIENLPEPMIFEGSITLTADSSDTTKCSITVSTPSSASNIKKGFTYKITAITASPAYTGTLKVGDTLIAAKAAPTVSSSWVQDTDWTIVPSGDETGYILGKASGTTQNDLVKWGADGFTVEDTGVSIETSAISDSDAKIPTSKSIKTNVAKTSVINGFTPVTTPTAHQTPATTDTINQALAKIDNNQRLNETNISLIQQEQIVQNNEIATLREITNCKLYGYRIDKQDVNPDTRVTYLYDAVGMTPAYMDFTGGSFNYGSWADIWFIAKNRPVALKFDGTVDYELDHTDFTKKLDGTASDVEDANYAGNFMSEIPLVYVKRWEDARYNYVVFCETKANDDYLAQDHTNANGTVNPYIYLPMFKGWKDSNNKLRSLMGTYPTGNTTGSNEVTYAENCGTGWQIMDKAKIDLIMDLIVLITKSTNCKAKIGTGDAKTYNASDTTNYGKMRSGYEVDGTTRSTNAQFYGAEALTNENDANFGKHHMIAFYIEDLWGNRWDRCLGFNLVENVYKVKMIAPYSLDSDSSYTTLTGITLPSAEGWLKNVSSGIYGDIPTEVGASNTTGFANYFYKNASGNRLSLFGGSCNIGLGVGRYWNLANASGYSRWVIGGSPCYNAL